MGNSTHSPLIAIHEPVPKFTTSMYVTIEVPEKAFLIRFFRLSQAILTTCKSLSVPSAYQVISTPNSFPDGGKFEILCQSSKQTALWLNNQSTNIVLHESPRVPARNDAMSGG